MPELNLDPWLDTWYADGGPIYGESDFRRPIVEPFNAVTAFAFVLLGVFWMARLRGQWRKRPFSAVAVPLLLVGGVGGTVYHALRTSRVFFLMDVVPVTLLVVAGSVYLWARLKPKLWAVGLLLAVLAAVNWLAFLRGGENHTAINVSYVTFAVMLLLPVAAVLWRTNGRHAGLIAL